MTHIPSTFLQRLRNIVRAISMLTAAAWFGLLACNAAVAQTTPAKPAPTAPAKPAAPVAAPAPTAAPSPAKIPSAEARAEARALGDRLGFAAQTQALMTQIRNQLAIGFANANQKPPVEVAKMVDEVLMPDIAGQSPEISNAIIDAWANAFTLDELKALRAFYAGPLGAKLLSAQPTIAQEWGAVAAPWTQKVPFLAIQVHLGELQARGLTNNPFKPQAAQPGPAATPVPVKP